MSISENDAFTESILVRRLTDKQFRKYPMTLDECMALLGIEPMRDIHGRLVPWECGLDEFGEIIYPNGYWDRDVSRMFFDEIKITDNGKVVIQFEISGL